MHVFPRRDRCRGHRGAGKVWRSSFRLPVRGMRVAPVPDRRKSSRLGPRRARSRGHLALCRHQRRSASVESTPGDRKSLCKDDAIHKPLKYWCFDESWRAEFSAIAEASAHLIATTVHGAGSAGGHTDPTRREQGHGSGRPQAGMRRTRRWRSRSACSPLPRASGTLTRFEPLDVNAQGGDFRFEGLPRQAQLGRRASRA